MTAGIDVRALDASTLEAALPLIAAYQRFYGAEPDDGRNRSFFRSFLAPSDAGMLLGGWVDSELVGFACLHWTFSSIHADQTVLLSDLLVREDARGRGVARALIQASAEVATERGARHIEWLTAVDNAAAQRLYDSLHAERSAWYGYEIHTGG